MRVLWLLVGICILMGALVAVVLAAATEGLCENCTDKSQERLQLVVAFIGLIPVTMLLVAALRAKARSAQIWAAISVVVYIIWAVLNDAAVHGWDNLVLLP